MDRRDFIRIVVTGSLGAAACRHRPGVGGRAGPGAEVLAETHAACHAVRDGVPFRIPPPSRHVEVAIVGGGSAGLFAARELGDRSWLLLEKEEALGGNATGASWRGVACSSGTSYNGDPDVRAVADELGVPMRPIDSVDGLVVDDTFIPEFLTEGLDRSPFPPAVRDGFRRFFERYAAHDVDAEVERLDNLPFDAILKDYPPELRRFMDSFGPNSWGGRVADTSAYVGIQAASWVGGLEPGRFTGDEGFGGLMRALGDRLAAGGAGRVVTGATVVQVRQDGGRAQVAWAPRETGAPVECVAADAVIVAAPKFMARHIVAGLPDDQREAMGRIRYIPYIVANLCFDGVVHDSCFDTNILGPERISDVVCADWPRLRGKGPADRPTILSCYMPLLEEDRAAVQEEAEAKRIALGALERVDRWFPGAAARCREIRAHLRGHPMHLSTVGMITRLGPRSSRSLGPIHFAGTDGIGQVADLATSLVSAREAARRAIATLDEAARRRA